MKRTVPRLSGPARDVARGELIGLPVRIVASTDPGLVGLAGAILDETLRTFTVRRTDGRDIVVGKAGTTFEFIGPRGPTVVAGDAIVFRPAERTKKVR